MFVVSIFFFFNQHLQFWITVDKMEASLIQVNVVDICVQPFFNSLVSFDFVDVLMS